MSIRADHTVASDKISQLEVTEAHSGDFVWTCLVDGEFLNAKAGDEWLHLVTPVIGWVAIKHAGRVYCELIDLDPLPSDEWPPYITLMTPDNQTQIYDKRN